MSDVQLIRTVDKLRASEAARLGMLNFAPLPLGLTVLQTFDNGSIYNSEMLDVTEETLHSCFLEGDCNVVNICLQAVYPSVASGPHSIIRGYKQVLTLSVETDYTFTLAERSRSTWLIRLP